MHPIDSMGLFVFLALALLVTAHVAWAFWQAWCDERDHGSIYKHRAMARELERKRVDPPYQGWDPRD